MKYELLQMQMQEKGTIVNCSSNSGLEGVPGRAIYNATKHGIIGLTKSASIEYAPKGIRISAICPGTIETPMIGRMPDLSREEAAKNSPIARLGKTSEIAEAVLWLSSLLSSYIVGQTIAVDGGVTIK